MRRTGLWIWGKEFLPAHTKHVLHLPHLPVAAPVSLLSLIRSFVICLFGCTVPACGHTPISGLSSPTRD